MANKPKFKIGDMVCLRYQDSIIIKSDGEYRRVETVTATHIGKIEAIRITGDIVTYFVSHYSVWQKEHDIEAYNEQSV